MDGIGIMVRLTRASTPSSRSAVSTETEVFLLIPTTMRKVDFYNDIKTYLSELRNTTIRSLEDIVAFNEAPANVYAEGGKPVCVSHPSI